MSWNFISIQKVLRFLPKTRLHFASPVSRSTSQSFPGCWQNDGGNAKFFHLHSLLPHSYICIYFCRCFQGGVDISDFPQIKAVRKNCSFFRPKKMKSSLFLLILERTNAEIALNNFQPMVVFRFWRNGEFTFFETSLQPLAVPTPYPVKSPVLPWRPVLSRFYSRVQRRWGRGSSVTWAWPPAHSGQTGRACAVPPKTFA